jgi:hypothetical protein
VDKVRSSRVKQGLVSRAPCKECPDAPHTVDTCLTLTRVT